MGVAELSAVLWRERQLLDQLLFKLEEEQLLLAGGRLRWLGYATREVEAVLGQVRAAELVRAMEAEELARDLTLAGGDRLLVLGEAAPEPWGDLLSGHRQALLAAVAEARQLAHGNLELLTTSYRESEAKLVSLQRARRQADARDTAPASPSTPQIVGRRTPERGRVAAPAGSRPDPQPHHEIGGRMREETRRNRATGDPDPAATIIELQLQLLTCQRALRADVRVLPLSLVAFLA